MAEKLIIWFFFGVLMSLAPVFLSAINPLGKGFKGVVYDSIARGDFLLITSTLCAAAVGELIGSRSPANVFKTICAAATLLMLFCSSVYYAIVSMSFTVNPGLVAGDKRIRALTCAFFGFGFFCSAMCVILGYDRPYLVIGL